MTTTGDLFVNIKGNNQGLKRSLNQSSRDIKSFSDKTEKQMGGGLGFGDMLSLTALNKFGAIKNAINKRVAKAPKRDHQAAYFGGGMFGELGRTNTVISRMRIDSATYQFKKAYHRRQVKMESDHLKARGLSPSLAWQIRQAKVQRLYEKRISKLDKRANAMERGRNLRGPAMAATAVAATAVAIILANGSKWATRMNQAGGKFSGAVIANRARINADNTRRDIALARDKGHMASVQFRDNMKDARRNAGAISAGAAMNYGLGAWDWFMAAMTQTTTAAFQSNRAINKNGGVI